MVRQLPSGWAQIGLGHDEVEAEEIPGPIRRRLRWLAERWYFLDNLRRKRARLHATASPWIEVDRLRWQKDEWCVDCGTRAVTFRYQNGFQLVTGEPAYRRVRGCPNWDSDMTPRGDPVLVMAFAGGVTPRPAVYTCGNKVTTDPEIELKHNHDESNVSLECELCLINMESARVMSKNDVTQRIAALHG